MSKYPNTFAEQHQRLEPGMLDPEGIVALGSLMSNGLEVVAGITRADVAEIAVIAGQPGLVEFCPKDQTERLGDEELAEKWLKKGDGRGAFLLRDEQHGAIAGYGWTGAEEYDQIPGSTHGFAVRLNEQYRGRKLATPFATVIVSGGVALHGASNIGLETWGSNTPAVRSYLGAGASLVSTKYSKRPTLEPDPDETDGMRRDVRLFMRFDRTFLEA